MFWAERVCQLDAGESQCSGWVEADEVVEMWGDWIFLRLAAQQAGSSCVADTEYYKNTKSVRNSGQTLRNRSSEYKRGMYDWRERGVIVEVNTDTQKNPAG
jgi:hypothetical protein